MLGRLRVFYIDNNKKTYKMIITFTIQEIESKEILLSDAIQTTNRTEFINFLNDIEELNVEPLTMGNRLFFYLEEGEEVFYERYVGTVAAANIIKDHILDYVASGAMSFEGK